jgi:hypothetical protein
MPLESLLDLLAKIAVHLTPPHYLSSAKMRYLRRTNPIKKLNRVSPSAQAFIKPDRLVWQSGTCGL